MQPRSLKEHLEVLGLRLGATWTDARRSYRELAKVWHPDRFVGDPELQARAEETLKRINVSYEWISANRESLSSTAGSARPQRPQTQRQTQPPPQPKQSEARSDRQEESTQGHASQTRQRSRDSTGSRQDRETSTDTAPGSSGSGYGPLGWLLIAFLCFAVVSGVIDLLSDIGSAFSPPRRETPPQITQTHGGSLSDTLAEAEESATRSAAGIRRVRNGPLNIRRGPSRDFRVLGTLNQGQRVLVRGNWGGYTQLLNEDSLRPAGWVHLDYLSREPKSATNSTSVAINGPLEQKKAGARNETPQEPNVLDGSLTEGTGRCEGWSIGSSRGWVLHQQGQPDSHTASGTTETFHYGDAWITLTDGFVSSYGSFSLSEPCRAESAPPPTTRRTSEPDVMPPPVENPVRSPSWSVGSLRRVVVFVQGEPTRTTSRGEIETLWYGGAWVKFRDNRVIDFGGFHSE